MMRSKSATHSSDVSRTRRTMGLSKTLMLLFIKAKERERGCLAGFVPNEMCTDVTGVRRNCLATCATSRQDHALNCHVTGGCLSDLSHRLKAQAWSFDDDVTIIAISKCCQLSRATEVGSLHAYSAPKPTHIVQLE